MKLRNWHAIAIISCLVWLAYYPALSAPLNSIDDARLANDLLNHAAFTWQDFWKPHSKSYFRPLINSSFILDQLLWGFEDSFLHLENILIHWINTLLVYRIGLRIAGFLSLDTLLLPAVAAVLFGLHPINSEAVIWIAGRADLLATTFVLLSLLALFRYLQCGSSVWLAGVALAFLIGSLAKETAILILPGMLAFGWVAFREETPTRLSLNRAFRPTLVSFVALAVYAVLRAMAMSGGDLGVRHAVQVMKGAGPPVPVPQSLQGSVVSQLLDTLRILLKGAGFYARKLIQPFPLNFGIVELADGYLWAGCLVILLFVFLFMRLTWWSGFIVSAVSLASVALLVALGNISWTPFAERYMYAPCAMFALGVSIGGGQLAKQWSGSPWLPRLSGLFVLVMLMCALAIFQRAVIWQDNLTLFADTVEKSPGFTLAQNQLAQALWNKGRKVEALDILRRIDLPVEQVAFLNKEMILSEEGRLDDARQFLLESLSRKETSAYHRIILERLVDVVQRQRQNAYSPAQTLLYDDEIISYLQRLWKLTGEPFYLYRLGQKQMEKGDIALARESFSEAYRKFPAESIYKEPSRKLAERLKGQ